MIVLFIFIVTIIIFACLGCNSTDNHKNNENKKEVKPMTETDIILNIRKLCKEKEFIKYDDELKIYSPIEKDKDDLFDEVFKHNVFNKMYKKLCNW